MFDLDDAHLREDATEDVVMLRGIRVRNVFNHSSFLVQREVMARC